MEILRFPSARTVAALPWVILLAGCAVSAVSTATTSVSPGKVSLTPTCGGILCTPEGNSAGDSASHSPTQTPTLPSQVLSPTSTPQPGLKFTPPSLISQQGLLTLTVRIDGYSHLWLWPMGSPEPLPLTVGDYDDRDPAFRPDGGAVAFASQRGGQWDLYLLDLASGDTQRLTDSDDCESNPSWSPDSRQLAYERYVNGHFRISIRRVEDLELMWPGPEEMDSFEPSWSPLARMISFTGRTGKHTDIYLLNLDTQQVTNLTDTPDLDERHSAFSPDGASVAYAVEQNGYTWTYRVSATAEPGNPLLIGQGDRPEWSPDGKWVAGVFQPDLLQSYILFSPSDQQVLSPSALWLTGKVEKISWSSAVLPDPLPEWLLAVSEKQPTGTPTPLSAGTPLSTELITVDVNAPDPRLSSIVVERFRALRSAVKKQAGWDFLGTLDDAVIDINTPMPPKETLSWLRTGRAFAISRSAVSKGWLVVVPDPAGPSEYWHLFIRTTSQDGSQGEPLRELPWDFDARTSGDPSAFDNGGQFYEKIPSGFFIDFSQLAAENGFQRVPSDPDWRTYYFGIHYWEYVCTDGLDWFAAMGELYPPYAYITPTPSSTPTVNTTTHWVPPATQTRTPSRTRTPSKTP
jgi:TolB protein